MSPLLKDATNIRVGSTAANAVYLGTTKIWPVTGATGIVQQNSGTFTGTGNFTVSLPVAPAATSLVVAFLCGNNISTAPSGWTQRTSQVNWMGHYLWDRQGDGTTSSWTFNVATPAAEIWWLVEIRNGVYLSSNGQNDPVAGTTYGSGSITPTAGNQVLLASIGSVDNITGQTVSGWTNSFVESVDKQAGGDQPMMGGATLEVVANGSTAYSTSATFLSSTRGRSGLIGAYGWS